MDVSPVLSMLEVMMIPYFLLMLPEGG